MQNVESLSGGKVKIAAGTLYGAIENLLKRNMIVQVGSYESRKKVYALTPVGRNVLDLEYQRMTHLIQISDQLFHQFM